MATVEVSIKSHTIVLPLKGSATVATISAAALAEYRSFHLRGNPEKVLFTRDSKGRILSGALSLPHEDVLGGLEVIVEAYSQTDTAGDFLFTTLKCISNYFLVDPSEVRKLYKDWQIWASVQMKEHLRWLCFRDIPTSPDKVCLNLLEELSNVSDEKLQLSCLASYHLLLTKFPEKVVIVHAADRICQIFAGTKQPSVALASLHCFGDLSPLQLKLFDGSKYIKDLADVEKHLLRFPEDARGEIFRAFESVASLMEDEDLIQLLQRKDQEMKEQPLVTDATDTKPPDDIIAESEALAVKNIAFNIGRTLSLLNSEDPQLRTYALEKTRRALQSTHIPLHSHHRRQQSILQHKDLSSSDKNSNNSSSEMIKFRDVSEYRSFITTIFQCLKSSLRARQSSRKQATAGHTTVSMAGRLISTALALPENDRHTAMLCVECLWLLATTPLDIPGIQPLYDGPKKHVSPLTAAAITPAQEQLAAAAGDMHRMLFTLSHAAEAPMLSALIGSEKQIEVMAEQAAFLFALVLLRRGATGWKTSALKLEPPALRACLSIKESSYRLYMGLTFLVHMAELVQDTAEQLGTDAYKPTNYNLQKEKKARRKRNEESNDTTTITSLPTNNENTLGNSMPPPAQPASDDSNFSPEKEPSHAEQLQSLLMEDDGQLLGLLWRWGVGDEANFLLRRLALQVLAIASTLNHMAEYLWRQEPIPRLLELLTLSYRSAGRRITLLHRPVASMGYLDDNTVNEEEAVMLSDDSYAISDDDEEDSINGKKNSRAVKTEQYLLHRAAELQQSAHNSPRHAPPIVKEGSTLEFRSAVHHIKVDKRMVRSLLKLILNLIVAPSATKQFSGNSRRQLARYLDSLSIGPEGDGSVSKVALGIPLEHVARNDKIVAAYLFLLEQVLNSSSKDEEVSNNRASTERKR